jgi:hypothetical protein
VRSLDAGAWFDERLTGEQIPFSTRLLSLEGIKLELEIERIQTSGLVRTPNGPNGIRTRAATLKGWQVIRPHVSVSPDKTQLPHAKFSSNQMMGIVWALTPFVENSNESIQGPRSQSAGQNVNRIVSSPMPVFTRGMPENYNWLDCGPHCAMRWSISME